MMAVVEVDFRADNMGLDPLPDIDFNIRCGNTLVGYATEEELVKDLDNPSDFNQMWANDEFKEKLKTRCSLSPRLTIRSRLCNLRKARTWQRSNRQSVD